MSCLGSLIFKVPHVLSCLSRGGRQAQEVLSLLVLLLYMSVQPLAVSPALHHLVHPDPDQPGHYCVATLLSQGHIDLNPVEPVISRPTIIERKFFSRIVHIGLAPDYRLMPERAPPSLLS